MTKDRRDPRSLGSYMLVEGNRKERNESVSENKTCSQGKRKKVTCGVGE